MKARLSREEQILLSHCSIELLSLFVDLSRHQSFAELKKLINNIIDMEKNYFFTEQEFDEKQLFVRHAFARGSVASLTKLMHLIGSAEHERSKRKEEV